MSSLYPAYKCNKEDWLKKAIDNTTYSPKFNESIDKAFDETNNKAFCKDKAQACLNCLCEYEIVENQTRDSISSQVTNVLEGDNEVKYTKHRSETVRIGNGSIVAAIFHHIPKRQGTKSFISLCLFKH
ncbi:hypothetical protein BDC45DRAFT_575294 [Circinella umbellata]|nr:hypothetical protein BDC45DRAFT_575294 [Circinella umbellata]